MKLRTVLNHAEDTDLVGQILGKSYKIVRKIGEGGMGAVYEATHVRVPRKFAVKMLNKEALSNEEVFNRFRREAEIASSLGHDNIIQVFDFNKTDAGVPFMVLEYLEGQDLESYIEKNGKCDLGFINTIFEQIASGLQATHAQGIVHRDLKPANIFLCKNSRGHIKVKILDFGISKIGDSTTMVTKAGAIFGTPDYMSPEQADGRNAEIDPRTDVFALGSIITECITGKPAFKSDTLMGTLYKIVNGSPISIPEHEPECPPEIIQAVNNALQKNMEARTPSVWQFYEQFFAGCMTDSRFAEAIQSQDFMTPVSAVMTPATPYSSTSPSGLPVVSSPSVATVSGDSPTTFDDIGEFPPRSKFPIPLKIIVPAVLAILALGALLLRPSKDADVDTSDAKAAATTTTNETTEATSKDMQTKPALQKADDKAGTKKNTTAPTETKPEVKATIPTPKAETKKATEKPAIKKNTAKKSTTSKSVKKKSTNKKPTKPKKPKKKKAWDPLSDR